MRAPSVTGLPSTCTAGVSPEGFTCTMRQPVGAGVLVGVAVGVGVFVLALLVVEQPRGPAKRAAPKLVAARTPTQTPNRFVMAPRSSLNRSLNDRRTLRPRGGLSIKQEWRRGTQQPDGPMAAKYVGRHPAEYTHRFNRRHDLNGLFHRVLTTCVGRTRSQQAHFSDRHDPSQMQGKPIWAGTDAMGYARGRATSKRMHTARRACVTVPGTAAGHP